MLKEISKTWRVSKMTKMDMIDGFPEYMRESIEKVERTRKGRMKKRHKPMSPKEKEKILDKYHPDYKRERKRAMLFGPNKGDLMPDELVDLLEAHPLVKPGNIDLSHIDYDVDVLIIGGGGAATVAALWANNTGIKTEDILMATKLRHGDANSMMAEGGIQCADRKDDTPMRHYLDTMGGGHFTNDPEVLKTLVTDAQEILKWHEELGVMYDKDENGEFIEISGGGTSKNRLHFARDYTGMEIMRNIRDVMRNREIPVLEFTPAVELITDDLGQLAGAVLYNMETEQYYVARAKSTVLATGGWGRLHIQNYPTTNHYGATADGLVLSYHVGAKLRDLDAVQYHPTGAAYPEQIIGLLITEKFRGMGAQIVNKDGEQFVYPLEARDVEASALIRECYERNNGVVTPTDMRGVWLDSPMIEILHGEGAVKKNFDAMYRMYERFGINMAKDPVLVFPTLHYQNGGVTIDVNAQTSVPSLFAGGEVEGGPHGKNRLMGNSLLDYNVFGRRAGISAAKHVKKAKIGKLTLNHVEKYEKMISDARVKTDRKAPMLLPEYRGKEALSRSLDIF